MKLPFYFIYAYVQMLPRLKAEDSLERIADMMVAFGTMDPDARLQLIRELQKMIGQTIKQPTLSPAQARIILQNMGIEVNYGNSR